jgi:hypothetical protein
MNREFKKVGANSATSDKGFTVTWPPSGGVDYSDASGTANARQRTDANIPST